jgi:hypothetical protein
MPGIMSISPTSTVLASYGCWAFMELQDPFIMGKEFGERISARTKE